MRTTSGRPTATKAWNQYHALPDKRGHLTVSIPTAIALAVCGVLCVTSAAAGAAQADSPRCIRGIYPHLAFFNGGNECGVGALVPWAGRLWVITYPPHHTTGGPDKLYEIDEGLTARIRPESVGGTHAGRMIHRESDQLIIGPYFIDAEGNVRAADVKGKLIGRMTAVMRHLTDPAEKVLFFDMEGAIYEVHVRTLAVKKLFANPVPGDHGKGGYTAQGRVVIANNGERRPKAAGEYGVLAEWDGKRWRVIERKQFCEVTGPGGLHGSPDANSPLWATGWDRRSVILKLLDAGTWHTFRLPKASNTYDGVHGWYTEWPRIRRVAPDRLMMSMHGMFYDFPAGFGARATGGLRPICSYLRYVPDFCHWGGRLVLGGDDTSIMQNPMAGQSQSNLWFGQLSDLPGFGPRSGWGGVWVDDPVRAGETSDPFGVNGFEQRIVHLAHDAAEAVTFTLEIDARGDGNWRRHATVTVPAAGYRWHILPPKTKAAWLRLRADADCRATAYLHLASPRPAAEGADKLFASLAAAGETAAISGGIIRPGRHNRNLQFLARTVDRAGEAHDAGHFEIDEHLTFTPGPAETATRVEQIAAVKTDFTVEAASVIMTQNGRRYRLPKGDPACEKPSPLGRRRGIRECVSERYLVNVHGTFYEMPRGRGLPKIKPVCTHGRQITDFCTWRGLLVLAGNRQSATPDGEYFASADGKVGLWFGHIDDLWRLGKPTGTGGPWHDTPVAAGVPSDPYLMTGYDRKTLTLSHDADAPVTFTVEVDITADGTWHRYARLLAAPGKPLTHTFPPGYNARWVRLTANKPCRATARFTYE